jgi:hypothetical protein
MSHCRTLQKNASLIFYQLFTILTRIWKIKRVFHAIKLQFSLQIFSLNKNFILGSLEATNIQELFVTRVSKPQTCVLKSHSK